MNLTVRTERWPLQRAFTISRGSKIEAVVVVAELEHGGHRGRGEAVPYLRYGETPEGVAATIEARGAALRGGLDRIGLQTAMPSGAARNAHRPQFRPSVGLTPAGRTTVGRIMLR